MTDLDDTKSYLTDIKNKIDTIVSRGERVIEQIPELIKNVQKDKIDPAQIEAIQVDKRVLKRRYGTTQAASMAGISHSLLYAAEADGRLPKPDYRADTVKKVRAGYTINQINKIREVFGTAPRKPDNAHAAIVGILNLKGGSQKTTICHLFSQYLALQGYRVLLLDTDPQGSLSFYYGKKPDVDVFYEDTIAPFLLDDEDALIEAGYAAGASSTLHYAVKPTYWSNIDIIPSCLQNLNIDLEMPKMMSVANVPIVDRVMKLRHGVQEVATNYDFVIIDGTPSLNLSTLNVVSACDVCFTPTPAAMSDFASTLQFANLVAETIGSYEESGVYANIPDMRYFITKYTKSSYAQFMAQIIRRVFNVERGDVLSNEAYHSDEIGKATSNITSIYEVNPSEADNRARLKKTITMFDRLFGEMLDAVSDVCFGSIERASHAEKIDTIMHNSQDMESVMPTITATAQK
jgi:chromosome partitioning protein